MPRHLRGTELRKRLRDEENVDNMRVIGVERSREIGDEDFLLVKSPIEP
jgi:hypothetical protein